MDSGGLVALFGRELPHGGECGRPYEEWAIELREDGRWMARLPGEGGDSGSFAVWRAFHSWREALAAVRAAEAKHE